MSVLDVIKKRRSVRKYKTDPVSEDILFRVLEAAQLAPSGKNFQPWRFIVVRDKTIRKQLAQASAGQTFMAEAPIILAACGFPEKSYPRMGRYMKSWTVDVAIALEHVILQSAEEGLGTCWIGAFEETEVRTILGVPEEARVLALTPLGWPAEDPPPRGRKPIKEIVSYDKF